MLRIIMNPAFIAHWTRMPHSIGRLSASASSDHSLSSAAFITNIAESDFRHSYQGDGGLATRIRYSSRERERSEAPRGTWAWLTALKWVIGYGYYPQLAIYWAIGLVIMGAIVLRVSGGGTAQWYAVRPCLQLRYPAADHQAARQAQSDRSENMGALLFL